MNDIKSGVVHISWEPIKGAVTYAVEKSTDGGQNWINGTYSSRSRITMDGFEPGTNVRFRVKAIGRKDNNSNVSETSLWIS